MSQTISREVSRAIAIARAAVLSISIFRVVISLGGTTYYYVGASNKWDTAGCYSLTDGGDGGAGVPGPDDSIRISKGQTVYLDDSTIGFLNGVKEVNFRANDATAYIHLEDDFSLDCWFGDLDNTGCTGVYLVKTGPGKLMFGRPGNGEHNTGQDSYYYNIGLDIREGSVVSEPIWSSTRSRRYVYKNIILAEKAVFYGLTNANQCVWSISGSGLITNLCNGTRPGLRITKGYNPPTVFSGRITGFSVFQPAGSTYYTGTGSTPSTINPFNYSGGSAGITGFATLAGASGTPSSLGSGGIAGDISPYYLLYLGTGETVVRDFSFGLASAEYPFVIDAGAKGGLLFANKFKASSDTVLQQQRLLLTGSNTVACVFSNSFVRSEGGATMYVKKSGSGTWRFADSASQTFSGVIEVEEGTLEFDSIRPSGMVSSLGTSMDRYEDRCAVTGSLARVDYAYLLGGTKGETVFSYLGSAPSVVHDRPIALQGNALLKAPNTSTLKWKSVFAAKPGETKLTVDCVQGQTNYLADISDGAGRVSIAKSGAGDLVLSGALEFTGDLVARGGGSLTVFNPKGELYSWYRLVLRETASTSPLEEYSAYPRNFARVSLNEWGLYTASGVRRNQYGASALGDCEATLPPGNIICANDDLLSKYPLKTGVYAHAARLLDNNNSSGYRFDVCWNGDSTPILANDPSTWIYVVLHMGNYQDEITSYDLNYVAAPGFGNKERNPVSWTVEGSGDGFVWEELAAVDGSLAPNTLTNYYCWISDGTSSLGYNNKPESAPHAKLPLSSSRVRADYTQLESLRSVSVESGTTLKKVGQGTITIGRIAADADGIGTIDGFSFAADGVLAIGSMPPGTTVAKIPADFVNAPGLANIAGWPVEVEINGQVSRRFRVTSVSPTAITVCRRGYVVSFR